MRLIQLESLSLGRYLFPSFDHVHRRCLNGVVQVIEVAEYICKAYARVLMN